MAAELQYPSYRKDQKGIERGQCASLAEIHCIEDSPHRQLKMRCWGLLWDLHVKSTPFLVHLQGSLELVRALVSEHPLQPSSCSKGAPQDCL